MTEKPKSKTSNFRPYGAIYSKTIKLILEPFPSFQIIDWPLFDEFVGGFRVKEFSILCAPTGIGKTQWLASLAAVFLKRKIKHFVASVETGPYDFVARTMSAVGSYDFNTGKAVSLEKVNEFDRRHGSLFHGDMGILSLHENRIPLVQLLDELEEAASMGCRVAILDNLNFFMEVVTANQSVVEMDRVIHDLIMLCKRIDLHIIMVMHPKKTYSKNGGDVGRVVSEFDIKGSSTAVQEAHNVFLLNRPTEDQINGIGVKVTRNPTDRELTIRKLRRRGMYVGRSIWFKYENGRYSEALPTL